MRRISDDICFSEAAQRALAFRHFAPLALPEKVDLYRALTGYNIAGAL